MSEKVKFFFDTEFIEYPNTIDLISIGIVCENGSELYAVNGECDTTKADDWVRENVLLKMPEYDKDAGLLIGMSIDQIKEKILSYVNYNCGQDSEGRERPEFWAYYADYDWVVFCWLFGKMINLPRGWPMYCRDLKQWCDDLGNPRLPEQGSSEHNALDDAKWNKMVWEFLNLRKLHSNAISHKYPSHTTGQVIEMQKDHFIKYSDKYKF